MLCKRFLLTLVLLCPDIYGVKDVLDQLKYHLILIKLFLIDALLIQ